MTTNFLDLYNECAGQPWSMFDSDAESNDDLESSLKTSINKACSYLWSLQPWIFRYKTKNIRTVTDRASYKLPLGALRRKVIDRTLKFGIKYNGKYLKYMEDYELQDEKKGEPEYFYVDGNMLYIYPTPDDVYTIELSYLSLAYAKNKDEEEIYKLSIDSDTLNISDTFNAYEELFKNCLISKAMMYAIADKSDENYSGYEEQYNDALAILQQYCSTSFLDRSIVF